MTKKELRLNFKSQRNLLSSDLIQKHSFTISNRLLSLPIWHFTYFHLFLTIEKNKEINTTPVLSILQGKDKEVVIPKIVGDDQMQHYLLTDSTVLAPNTLGIPEPQDGITVKESRIDVVFIPLLAFDDTGNRVGYGKGYYDRFLKKCRSQVVKIGLSFFEAAPAIVDITEKDVPLDYCVTPERVYSF